MKFDEMNVEQLEARQAEIAGMETEGATAEELARIAEDERRTAALDRLNKLIEEVKQHEV